ncbi:glutathione S-transferase C-terminal domain-containing protein [Cyanobium sp. ATX-6F1]|uniref:glutathione S-transferase C-terminal domain-containing protein n=1 Tax=Cyanobium sp. ATX-6F1 TaxID=3137388 RepID=UPI0039BE48FB
MPIPPLVVSSVRRLWHCQWRQLMGGLGPADADGNYRRPAGAFAAVPELPAGAAEPGRHVLIVGRSCPWAHRTWLVWSLRRLDTSIEQLVVEPDPERGRWRFVEPFEGASALIDLYRRSGSPAGARATVPALYDRRLGRIVANESAVLVDLLNHWPGPEDAPNLAPAGLSDPIQRWRELFQSAVNDGVYRCGFARNQGAYDRAEAALFAALEEAEAELTARGPWLCGEQLTLADVVLFPTLIRMELVYAPLFGRSRRPLWQFPALSAWRARLFATAGVAASCDAPAWRRDYFGALFPLHPSGIVPAGPELATLVNGPPVAPQP